MNFALPAIIPLLPIHPLVSFAERRGKRKAAQLSGDGMGEPSRKIGTAVSTGALAAETAVTPVQPEALQHGQGKETGAGTWRLSSPASWFKSASNGISKLLTATEWQINSGISPSGPDLCSGIIFGCLQGYLSNGNGTFIDFSRVVNAVDANQAAYDDRQTLLDCETVSAMGNAVIQGLTLGEGGPTQTCTTLSAIWRYWQTSFEVIDLPAVACSATQGALQGVAQGCQSALVSAETDLKWLGFLALLVIPIGCCVCYCATRDSRPSSADGAAGGVGGASMDMQHS